VSDGVRLGAEAVWLLPVLVVAAATVAWLARLGHGAAIVTASVRAAVQLALVGLVVAAALRSLPWSALMLVAMVTIAGLTSARRLGSLRAMAVPAFLAVGVPPAAVVAALLLSGALPSAPQALLPTGGILIGGAMTASTLAGRRLLADLSGRWGEIEAAVSLGLLPAAAVRESVGRIAASEALVPALDQTRTVGLVTLPGAFVGMLLGGASAGEAALVQLLVLVSLLAVEAVAALLVTELAGRAAFAARGSRPR
jgi:putative ABC transport system permease protein